jgi:sugar lactone lactonase YvrE
MFNQYRLFRFTCLALLAISLLLAACGDPTATPASPATSNPATAKATTAAAPATATTAPTLTPIPTTASATTASPVDAGLTVKAGATTARTASNTLQLVWKTNGGNDKLKEPIGLAVDRQGDVYVSDAANNFVQKFDANGKFLLQWGKTGKGEGEFSFSGSGPTAGFLAVDKDGNLYVSDCYNSRVQVFDPDGKFLRSFGTEPGSGQMMLPGPITFDDKGNIYVAARVDSINMYDSTGKFLKQFNIPGEALKYAGVGAIDQQGNLYVAELLDSRVRKFDSTGKFLVSFGSKGSADGQFAAPVGTALDSQGNLYVTDNSHRIQKFDPTGKFLVSWDSAGGTQFGRTVSLVMDNQGYLYLTDGGAGMVYKLKP